MLKFGLKFLQDKKKDGKHLSQEVKPELPAFEWQVTEETGFESFLPPPSLSPPEDAIFGNTSDRRRKSYRVHLRSSTNVESGRLRLIQIIEDDDSRTKFRGYLVSRYCEENLDFYMDIRKFHSHFENENFKINEIITAANYIWNEYLDPETSSNPLNVPQELSNNCKQKISKNLFTVDLFDKLQQHCFDLMVQDSLPKFTRNSMVIPSTLSLSEQQNCPPTPNYLCPPSFDTPPPRKSLSSGSLRAKIIASLKNVSESTSTSQSPINTTPSTPTSPTFPTSSPTSFPFAPASPQVSLQSSASSLTSTATASSVSTSTEPSTPTTPTSISILSTPINSADNSNRDSTTSTASTISASVLNGQNRISIASAMSISNITKRILSGRRNSTSSNSSQFSVSSLSSVLYLSSMEKFRNMPGSYPVANNNNNKDKKDEEDKDINDSSSTWQRLRRNISTPNLQTRPMTRSRSSTLANNVQTYNPDKNLPPLPS